MKFLTYFLFIIFFANTAVYAQTAGTFQAGKTISASKLNSSFASKLDYCSDRPSSPVAGMTCFNSSTKKMETWDGTNWRESSQKRFTSWITAQNATV